MGDGLIINRAFGYAPDQPLRLRGGEYNRKMIYGGGWARLRLGIIVAVQRDESYGTNNIQSAPLFWGVGTFGYPVSGYATQNFVGVSLVGAPSPGSTQTLTYNVGSGGNDYYTPTAGQTFRKYSSTFVGGTACGAGAYFPLTAGTSALVGVATEPRRAVFIMDITRPRGGSGTGAISVYCTTTAQVSLDFRADNMFSAMDQIGTPTLLGTAMTVLVSAGSITIGEELGPLDTIMLYWGRNAFPLDVYAIGGNVIFSNDYGVDPPSQPVAGGAYFTFEGFNVGTLTPGMVQSPAGTSLLASPLTGTNLLNSGFNGTVVMATGSFGPNSTNQAMYPVDASGAATANYGTALGYPFETFSAYGTGTASASIASINLGVGFVSYGSFYGTSNPGAKASGTFAGTAAGYPFDSFTFYGLGTVNSGVVINAGTGWSSYGSIYL